MPNEGSGRGEPSRDDTKRSTPAKARGWSAREKILTRTAAFTIKKLRSRMDDRAGFRFEVFTPVGWQFATGEHSRLCRDRDEADREAQDDNVFRCPRDCECGEGKETS